MAGPASREVPEQAATDKRLERFRAEYPEAKIVTHGYWHARIPEETGTRSSPAGTWASSSTSPTTCPHPEQKPGTERSSGPLSATSRTCP